MIKISYKTKTGTTATASKISEIDPQSPDIANVYKVEHKGATYHNTEAQSYLRREVVKYQRVKLGRSLNLLLKYREISNEFDKHTDTDIPITRTYRRYIYPKYFISRDTLYRIFNTDIEGEIQRVRQEIERLKQ